MSGQPHFHKGVDKKYKALFLRIGILRGVHMHLAVCVQNHSSYFHFQCHVLPKGNSLDHVTAPTMCMWSDMIGESVVEIT